MSRSFARFRVFVRLLIALLFAAMPGRLTAQQNATATLSGNVLDA